MKTISPFDDMTIEELELFNEISLSNDFNDNCLIQNNDIEILSNESINKYPFHAKNKKFSLSSNSNSIEVQISLLSERITYLTEYLKTNKQDLSSRLERLKLVGERKRLIKNNKSSFFQQKYSIPKEA